MTININGKLLDLTTPRAVGIINLTPDSFYSESRTQTDLAIISRAEQMLTEGAAMLDIGACSTRPGSTPVSKEEEMSRLRRGLNAITKALPHAAISVDTFRADIAKMCVEEYGAAVINDISAGLLDPQMFSTVASLHVPYILMHGGKEMVSGQSIDYGDDIIETLILYLGERINRLHDLGVCDIIVDPGFGFAKTMEQNYQILAHMEELHILHCPLLVGLSRKSMVQKLLNVTPQEALNGTTAIHMLALVTGANLLRTHDVKACTEAISIFNQYHKHQ